MRGGVLAGGLDQQLAAICGVAHRQPGSTVRSWDSFDRARQVFAAWGGSYGMGEYSTLCAV